ncbi:MAG: hypothetical protein K2J31_04885 [Alistipes sp.]|nr:hypothetical protein [Alistipes sp.]
MNRIRYAAAMLAVFLPVALGAQSPTDWLGELSRTMKGRYGVGFTMEMQGAQPMEGYYAVDGDNYYLTLGVSEVYGDGKLRYEINIERKEVTEDRVNIGSFDLLNNPTRAFDFVDAEFISEIESETADGALIVLQPRKSGDAISRIRISVRRTSHGVEPSSVEYDFDGDRITIGLKGIEFGAGVEVRRWNAKAYRAYEMISFL